MKRTLLLLALLFLVSKATLAQVPSYVPSNGLVGWWPFNGNANDESGNGNNGTVNGATLTNDRNGNVNSAYSFDGVDDYIEVPHSNFISITGDITMSAWTKTNGFNGLNYQTIVSKRETYWTWEYAMDLSFHNGTPHDTKLLAARALGMGNQEQGWSITPYIQNSWENWVVTISGNQMKIYKNGILDTSLAFTLVPVNQVCPLLFGKNTLADNTNSEQFFGKLDDIGIWNRALDSCEVKDLYFASLGNCCQASFNSQPQNQNANTGTSASFIAQSSSANPIYQWQSDLGLGWQNLSNAGQYSGVNNDTLSVTNLSAANNNQLFRCILMSGTCSDTSAAATLSVSQTNGLTTLQNEIISIYPNPATNQITVLSNAVRYPLSYKIYNELGQALLIGDLKASTTSIDISSLAPGNYMLVVGTKHVSFVKNKI